MAEKKFTWINTDPRFNFHSPHSDSTYSLDSEVGFQNDDTSSQYSDSSANDVNNALEVSKRIRSLFLEQKYTDVKFVINSNVEPKPTLLAHKAILAVGCEKFKEMFFDNKEDNSCSEFQIKNISYDAFRNVVEYIYTNELFFENEISAIETWSAALKFQLQSLVEKCEQYIDSSELTENNACTMFQMASNHELKSLKGRCAKFIQENTASILRSSDFLAASMSTVRSICKMEKLNLSSEIELFESVLQWVEAQPDSEKNKKLVIKSFLSNIRFLTLTCNEFNQFVQHHPSIFTAPEVSNIITHLTNPQEGVNLPSWCNKGINRCTMYQVPKKPNLKRVSTLDQRFSIPLKPCNESQFLTNLKCVVQLTVKRGFYSIKGIKLSFDNPVQESLINSLVISIFVEPTNYSFEEYIKIANSKNVVVIFSKVLTIRCGQTVTITAEANDIRYYKFLLFDETQSLVANYPFKCSLSREPKGGRFFFISEVIYKKITRTPRKFNRK